MITERCPPPDWDEPSEVEDHPLATASLSRYVDDLAILAAVAEREALRAEADRLLQLCRDLDRVLL